MRPITAWATILYAAACCPAALISERWAGEGASCAHPGTLKVLREAGGTRLVFDLSALPAGADVRHASLYCFTLGDRQPTEPARIHAAEKLDADGNGVAGGDALKLEAPWYRSFDATEAVRRWARSPQGNLGFVVSSFDGLVAAKSYLEIRYLPAGGQPAGGAGPAALPEQVSGLRAVHHDGQTFLVWKELKDFRPPADGVLYVEQFSRKGNKVVKEPGTGWRGLPRVPAITLKTLRQLEGMELREAPSGFQGIRPARRVREVPEVRYRIYRHDRRITAENLQDAQWVGEASPLSAYDQKMAVIDFKGEYIDQREVGESIIPVSCVEDGKSVQAGEAIYAHNPAQAGEFYYAVTSALAGTENAAQISGANSLAEPVVERLEPHKPVLQRLQEIQYGAGVLERWYLFWAGPPYANVPNKPLHVLVGEPEKLPQPWPMIVDGFHGGFNIVGAMRVPAGDALTLLIEHQIAWGGDGDLLYNEGLGTLRSFRECKADYFSQRYFLRMIEWAMGAWEIDRARVFGGQHDSGPLHFGLRHGEIFRRLFLGHYTASYDYKWSPPSQGLPTILGPRELAKTPEGHSAWDALDVGWWLRQDPGRDVPLILGGSDTGKDSGHTSEFGWQDDPRGWAALQETRQPFIISWGVGHADPGGSQHYRPLQPEIAESFATMRWDATIPAFSNCSLDDNPGSGDPADGEFCGQMNGYLAWDNRQAVDEPNRWEITVWLVKACPEDSCTVDVTPRHCQRFKPKAGQSFKWAAAPAGGGEGQSGQVAADRWGLATTRGIKVGKDKLKISIRGE